MSSFGEILIFYPNQKNFFEIPITDILGVDYMSIWQMKTQKRFFVFAFPQSVRLTKKRYGEAFHIHRLPWAVFPPVNKCRLRAQRMASSLRAQTCQGWCGGGAPVSQCFSVVFLLDLANDCERIGRQAHHLKKSTLICS